MGQSLWYQEAHSHYTAGGVDVCVCMVVGQSLCYQGTHSHYNAGGVEDWMLGGGDEFGHLEDEVNLFILKMILFKGQELLRAQENTLVKKKIFCPSVFSLIFYFGGWIVMAGTVGPHHLCT